MPALRPIQREEYLRDSQDIEALKVFALQQGVYLDNSSPGYPRTRLGALTAGTRVASGSRGTQPMRINGGIL